MPCCGQRRDRRAACRDRAKCATGAGELDIAKSRFLAVVSHELRTPLNAIIGFSDMLGHEMFGPFTDPRQKEYAGLIREAGSHLLSVVTSILDVSKIACGSYPIEPQLFRFSDAVEVCRSMVSLQAAEKSLTLETDIAPSAGRIVADRRAVQQMLINLMSNAVKFTPSGGTVTVGANRLGLPAAFLGERHRHRHQARRTSAGSAGRSRQVRNDYTREHDGAGLGLSLVKGLVELHEGSMMIESAPGEGTVVTISLPVAGPAGRPRRRTGRRSSSSRTTRVPMGKRARLPELDDEPAEPARRSLRRARRHAGAQSGAGRRHHRLHRRAVLRLGQRDLVPAAFPHRRLLRDARQQLCRPARSRPCRRRRSGSSARARRAPCPSPIRWSRRCRRCCKSMNLYEGEVDGLNGPNTRNAIAAYRKTIGMPVSGEIDEALLEQLGAGDTTAGITPEQPATAEPETARTAAEAAVVQEPAPIASLPERPQTVSVRTEEPAGADPMVKKIQAGLKAFGNDSMEIDGVIGSRTKSAIREFQSLFGLPVTGEPSQELYAKMREIGLVE